jgi:hypothetical protein
MPIFPADMEACRAADKRRASERKQEMENARAMYQKTIDEFAAKQSIDPSEVIVHISRR